MDAGKLDRRLQLLEPVTIIENERTNSKRQTYALKTTVWARRVPGGAVERVIGRALVNSSSVVYSIRYRTDIDARWKVQEGATMYRVLAVIPGPLRGQELLVECAAEGEGIAR